VANATDIESLNDFKDWLGYNAGAVIPQIGLTMAGAAIAGIPGALLTSTAFNFPAQIEQRVEFIMSTVKDLPPEDQAKAVMEYLDKTGDVTFAVTALQGGLDMFGPVGAILRKKLASKEGAELIAGYQTKQRAIKEALKDTPRQIGEETLTEGAQEIAAIGGERALDEQGELDALSKENLLRVLNTAAAGTVGGGVGATTNVAVAPVTPFLQQRAVRAEQDRVTREMQQKFVRDNAEAIGKKFDSLVVEYQKQGVPEAEAMKKSWRRSAFR